MKFDSKLEERQAAKLSALGFERNDDILPHLFSDGEQTFKARADFYHPRLDLYIELKCNSLNGKKTKAAADRAYKAAVDYNGKTTSYIQIEHQFNHSVIKQRQVQFGMEGKRKYLVVFEKHPDEKNIKRMANAYLDWTTIAHLERVIRKFEIQQFWHSD